MTEVYAIIRTKFHFGRWTKPEVHRLFATKESAQAWISNRKAGALTYRYRYRKMIVKE